MICFTVNIIVVYFKKTVHNLLLVANMLIHLSIPTNRYIKIHGPRKSRAP